MLGRYNDLIMMIPDKVKNKNPVKVKQYDAGYELHMVLWFSEQHVK